MPATRSTTPWTGKTLLWRAVVGVLILITFTGVNAFLLGISVEAEQPIPPAQYDDGE
jgi:uncharacterized membrane protein